MSEDIKGVPYDKLYAQLEKIVDELERGELGLEASVERYERGIQLYRECCGRLKGAEEKLMKIVQDSDGGLQLQSFEFKDEEQE